jgi:hypothetical protein
VEHPQARRTKRRVWHKVQLGIDKQTLEIRAVEATSSDVVDGPTVCDKARGRAVQGLGGRGVRGQSGVVAQHAPEATWPVSP